jgi:hypothetical protein
MASMGEFEIRGHDGYGLSESLMLPFQEISVLLRVLNCESSLR